ncbi:MAG: hypothetical protein QM817_26440 [Archangium sp.]
MSERETRGQRLVAVALVSGAVLLYEIAITRILSVVLWYHFAFLAMSLAMMGLSAPGIWFSLRKPKGDSILNALLLGALAVPSSVVALFRGTELLPRAETAMPGLSLLVHPEILLVLVCVLVPLLCLGSAVCLILFEAPPEELPTLYGTDLLGATVAAALVVPLMIAVPTPVLVAGAGLLPLAAAFVLSPRTRRATAVLAVALLSLLAWGKPFQLRVSKSYVEPETRLYERWTPTARITVFPDIFWKSEDTEGFGWGMGSKYVPQTVEQLWLEQDGSAGTPITRLSSTPAALEHLFFDVTSAGYQLRPPAKVCVIGAGGGRDVLSALKSGAASVDAVELNYGIVDAVSSHFREFSGDVYHFAGVTPHVSEGRAFLTQSAGGFDLIQISLIDSWAATAAGAFSLSENYLYTVEALRLYLERTSPHGLVSISRWMAGNRQLEAARLAVLATEALRQLGVANPQAHLAVLQAGGVGTFLISREPFTAEELERLRGIADERGFTVIWPVETPASMVASVLRDGVSAVSIPGVDLSPSTDDRPFFFQTLSLVSAQDSQLLAKLSHNERSVALLRLLVGVMTLLTLVLFLAPLALARVRTSPGVWRGSVYFLGIGLGFMFIETAWMQRFVLFLGHPSYATTVVLAAILFGSGIGSLLAGRISVDPKRVLLVLPVALLVLTWLHPKLFALGLGLPIGVRVVLSVLFLAPPALLMGFAFPLGMRAFATSNRTWLWAMNGAASVLSSVLSIAASMTLGFSGAAMIGVACYLVAWLTFVTSRSPSPA